MTPSFLIQAIPGTKREHAERYAPVLDEQMEKFGIDTPLRKAAFLAQCAHECGNFSVIKENLNYSADGLLKIFGKYFGSPPKKSAAAYARQPEKIANVVYANRMGNGDEASGEGWKYRGRGCIQTTGKSNYMNYARASGADAVNNPDLLLEPDHAVGSACFFWQNNRLNQFADQNTEDAFVRMTKRINGGTHGLDDRMSKWKSAKRAYGV